MIRASAPCACAQGSDRKFSPTFRFSDLLLTPDALYLVLSTGPVTHFRKRAKERNTVSLKKGNQLSRNA